MKNYNIKTAATSGCFQVTVIKIRNLMKSLITLRTAWIFLIISLSFQKKQFEIGKLLKAV